MIDFFKDLIANVNLFDLFVVLIFTYCVIQCFVKGFSLSLISFMKWVLSTVITIILVPKIRPIVSEYIESEFVNNVGIGILVFILTLFLIVVLGKGLGRAVTWTGVGSIDKSFGILFGFFKGYVVSVCIFSILNWFYPYKNWGISAEEALAFNIINKGSEILIKEFPSNKDLIDTKEKIEKI
tara:strand:+ start:1668 stop:2213 length:546 start_codon:yes stop_codon:yes gene_type:complete